MLGPPSVPITRAAWPSRDESAVAQVPGLGVGDGEREGDRHRRIGRVTAGAEDFSGRVGTVAIRRGDRGRKG